jgi:hypothetical protein
MAIPKSKKKTARKKTERKKPAARSKRAPRTRYKNRAYFEVSLVVPGGNPDFYEGLPTIRLLLEYIEEAVATWHGQLAPTHPLSDLASDQVRVRHTCGPLQ